MLGITRRIMVVDDDPALRLLLADTLTAVGYQCVSANDGVQALNLLKQEEGDPVDLIITDVKMPKMDGLGLLKNVRQHYPELPVLFITGVASESLIAEASPDGYLAKPFRIGQMEDLIERTLESQRSGRRGSPARSVLLSVGEGQFRDTLAEALICSHYIPFAVSDGNEAIEELKRGSFDVVIASLENPGRQTESAVKKIRRRYPSVAMVVLSESLTTADRERLGRKLGVDGFVKKSCEPLQLVEALDQAVARHRAALPPGPVN